MRVSIFIFVSLAVALAAAVQHDDFGTCGMPCCRQSWRIAGATPDTLFAAVQNIVRSGGGPDGHYALDGADTSEGLPYTFKLTHTTQGYTYTDSLRFNVNNASSSAAMPSALVTAFSISTVAQAYEDNGQNFVNLDTLFGALAKVFPGSVAENVFGCGMKQNASLSFGASDVIPSVRRFTLGGAEHYALTPAGWVLERCITAGLPSGATVEPAQDGSATVWHEGSAILKVAPCDTSMAPAAVDPALILQGGAEEEVRLLGRSRSGKKVSRARAGKGGILPPNYDGWQTYAQFQNPSGINSFLGSFSVPDIPVNTPSMDFIFTGLQNIPWIPKVQPEPHFFDIIQPVLQFPGDRGLYWSVKSWIVSLGFGGQTFATAEVPVKPGDYIFGNMTKTGPESWDIISTSQRTGQSVKLSTRANARLKVQPWAYVTLETYGADDCSFFPTQPSDFVNMSLTDASNSPIAANWTAIITPTQDLKCSTLHTQVVSPADVNIHFTATD